MKLICERVLSASMAVGALVGCATGPVFQAPEAPSPGRAVLYVYRPMGLYGGGMVHQIKIDQQTETLRLPNGGWQRIDLSPGVHSLAIADAWGLMHCSPTSLPLLLPADQATYVENVVELASYTPTGGIGVVTTRCSNVLRSPEQAVKSLAGLRNAQ